MQLRWFLLHAIPCCTAFYDNVLAVQLAFSYGFRPCSATKSLYI